MLGIFVWTRTAYGIIFKFYPLSHFKYNYVIALFYSEIMSALHKYNTRRLSNGSARQLGHMDWWSVSTLPGSNDTRVIISYFTENQLEPKAAAADLQIAVQTSSANHILVISHVRSLILSSFDYCPLWTSEEPHWPLMMYIMTTQFAANVILGWSTVTISCHIGRRHVTTVSDESTRRDDAAPSAAAAVRRRRCGDVAGGGDDSISDVVVAADDVWRVVVVTSMAVADATGKRRFSFFFKPQPQPLCK